MILDNLYLILAVYSLKIHRKLFSHPLNPALIEELMNLRMVQLLEMSQYLLSLYILHFLLQL